MAKVDTNPKSASTEWLTAEEAALHLKVKRRTLQLWARKGAMPAYALAGTRRRIWRFRREDLDAAVLLRNVVDSPSPTVLSNERRR